jgi:uncharacterized protein YecE (DUF72 family)
MLRSDTRLRIGTAGWSVTRDAAAAFPAEGSHLQRYAQGMNCVEINSSFYRSHRVQTYQRWAAQTPENFRFSAKLPRRITHEGRLQDVRAPLQSFLAEAAGLGDRLAVLLVQLPPSLAFDARVAGAFFALLRELHAGAVVCEPRHASWFTPAAEGLLVDSRISRAAADPPGFPAASVPGGWLGPAGDGRAAVLYHRWHGAPRMYWSRYETSWLQQRAQALQQWPADADRWCIFDNTAAGAALSNALELRTLLAPA